MSKLNEIKLKLKYVSQPALKSFYNLCCKKSGLNFWVPILFQRYQNMSGYDTGQTSGLNKRPL